jgi:hypothetical protein
MIILKCDEKLDKETSNMLTLLNGLWSCVTIVANLLKI